MTGTIYALTMAGWGIGPDRAKCVFLYQGKRDAEVCIQTMRKFSHSSVCTA